MHDTLFLCLGSNNQHDKKISIQFEDFQAVISQAKKWLANWHLTSKPISLEELIVSQESFSKRKYGDDKVDLAKNYILLCFIFHSAIKTVAQKPELLPKLFKAVKEFA